MFDQLVANQAGRKIDKDISELLEERDARLTGQILNKVRSMISDMLILSERSRAEVRGAFNSFNVPEILSGHPIDYRLLVCGDSVAAGSSITDSACVIRIINSTNISSVDRSWSNNVKFNSCKNYRERTRLDEKSAGNGSSRGRFPSRHSNRNATAFHCVLRRISNSAIPIWSHFPFFLDSTVYGWPIKTR